MKKYKFALLGYYGFGNLGDELLLKACLKILESCPREKIIVLSNNPAETSEKFNIKSVNRWKFAEVKETLKQSEILLLGGGGLFQDSTSIRSCAWYWAFVKFARLLGVRVFAIGQSIGPLKFKISKILTGDALRACEKLHVRDENSYRIASELKCKNVMLGHDLVMMLKPLRNNNTCEKNIILLNLRPCNDIEKYIDAIALKIRESKLTKIGAALSPDDIAILESYREKLNLERVIHIKTFEEAENLWASALYAVGMRLHFGVLSRIFRTPISLIPYDIKVSEFAKSSDIPLIIDEWKEPKMPLEIQDTQDFKI